MTNTPPFHGCMPVANEQVVGKHGRGFVKAVAVAVVQDQRFATGRTPPVGADRIVAHLDDPHAAVFVEANGDRIDDVRLAGDEFDLQARIDDDLLERLLRRNAAGWADGGLGSTRRSANRSANRRDDCDHGTRRGGQADRALHCSSLSRLDGRFDHLLARCRVRPASSTIS